MSDVKYTKDHEWVRVEGDNAVIGITDYAQEQLGDVVFVDLADVGLDLRPWGRGRATSSEIRGGSIEPAAGRCAEPAAGLLLNPVGERPDDEGRAHTRRTGRAIELSPSLFELRP